MVFDVTSRPICSWARNNTGSSITLRNYVIYGDSTGSPTANNVNGKPYQTYDEAGLLETSPYDFKGNLLYKNRYVISSAVLKSELDNYNTFVVDWTGLPSILDMSMSFDLEMAYDALNRLRELITPLDVAGNRGVIVPRYNRSGVLEKVSCSGTEYVENIVYDAKGQRLLIAYGNGMMTRYAYDPLTFRLLRQRSEKFTKNTVGNVITYAYNSGTNKQDDSFHFDLIGNIMTIMNRVTDCGINGSLLGDDALDRNFTYDPIYRLLTADGRESDTQSGNNYLYDDAPAPGSPNANHVRSYDRSYSYDKLGNIIDVVQSGIHGFTRNYVYHANKNTLEKIEDATPATIEDYIYDANGNQVAAGSTRNYVWNHADQLICYYNQAGVSPTVFTQYDYSGQDRVSKLVRTGSTYERTIYIDGIFEYVKLENGSTYEKNYVHIMDDQSRIAEVRINVGTAFPNDIADDIVYNLEDQIGSSTVRLDTNATIIDKEEYYPFGDSSLRTFTYKRYRYVGKERDAESGLYYYGARYYAAWTCRFISVDPLAADYPHLTPYNYAGNKPIGDIDIDGMQGTGEQKQGNSGGGGTTTGGVQGTNPMLTTVTTHNVTTTYSALQAPTPTVLDECSGNCQTVRGPIIGDTGGYNVDIPKDATTLTGQQPFPIAGKPDNKINTTLAFSYTDDNGAFKMFEWSPEINAFYGGNNEIYGGKGVARVSGYTSAAFGMPNYFANHPSSSEGKVFGDMQFTINAVAAGVGVVQLGSVGIRMALSRFASSNSSLVSQVAKLRSIFSAQKNLKDLGTVETYLTQMRNGTYDSSKGAAGFIYEGKTVLTDGNHRMNAAIKYSIETGDDKFINTLIQNGNFNNANPASYGYKTFNFAVKPK